MYIMYHRIADKPECCKISTFKKQVKDAKKIGVRLTFDDGLKEHYTIALPILKKYGMRGTFFIVTSFETQFAPLHKARLLLSKSDKLIKELNIGDKKIYPQQWYFVNTTPIGNLKYFLNANPDILDKYFNEYFDEKEEINKLSMTWEEIKELHENGMEIGCHTHTHPMLSKLSSSQQEHEISMSTHILAKKIERPTAFSYPFGMYNDTTIKLLKEYKYKWAVTTEKDNAFALRRIDTNDF